MANITISIWFQDSLLRDIDRTARAEARSRSEFLRDAARAYIRRKQLRADIFAMGPTIAKQRGLTPEDVSREINAYRTSTASRGQR